MNINQEQLLMFQAVIETGSFSAAARKLGKVPSAVSMSIANLEIDLDLTLFDRKAANPSLLTKHGFYMKRPLSF